MQPEGPADAAQVVAARHVGVLVQEHRDRLLVLELAQEPLGDPDVRLAPARQRARIVQPDPGPLVRGSPDRPSGPDRDSKAFARIRPGALWGGT